MGETPPWIDNYDTFVDRQAVVVKPYGIISGNDGDVTLSCVTYELLKNHPKPYCIDIGCAEGWWTGFVRMINTKSEIISFEPNPEAYAKLKERFQDASGLLILPYAVSNSHGTMDFVLKGEQSNSRQETLDAIDGKNTISVNKVMLEPFIRPRVDMLKIDVEGHEPAILYSLEKHFSKIDTIVFEYTPYWMSGGLELLEYMAAHYPYMAHLSRRHQIHLSPLPTSESRKNLYEFCIQNNFQTDILVSRQPIFSTKIEA